MSMRDEYMSRMLTYEVGDAPQECSSPMELDAHRERLLSYPLLDIDTYDAGYPISGDARVHYDMAVLRGWIESD